MWIRKSSVEIAETDRQKKRKRFSPLGPLLLTVALALVEWIVGRDTPRPFFSPGPALVIWFLVVFGLLYFSRVALGTYVLFRPSLFSARVKPAMICSQCQTSQVDAGSHRCSCGGLLEPLDHWHWLEDDRAPTKLSGHP
jgi:hypothetical protein